MCGFTRGASAAIADGSGRFDLFIVNATNQALNSVSSSEAFAEPYPAGSLVIEVDAHTFRLDAQPDGSKTLVRETVAGAIQPIVDHVAGLSFLDTGAQLEVNLTLHAAHAEYRRVRERAFRAGVFLRNVPMTGQRGIALILVLLVTSFLSAIGLGLALIVIMDRLATGNLRGSVAMLYAADAAIELAARDLAMIEDWSLALTGASRSSFVDVGPMGGVRAIPGGGAVDLTAATNLLNCGKAMTCSDAEMDANSKERPWGANNARWQLYAYGPFTDIAQLARPEPCYLAVWVADDAREEDADPLT